MYLSSISIEDMFDKGFAIYSFVAKGVYKRVLLKPHAFQKNKYFLIGTFIIGLVLSGGLEINFEFKLANS